MKFYSWNVPFSTDWRQLESHFGSQLMTRLESHYGSCFVSLFGSHFAKVAIIKRPSINLATIFRSAETSGDRQFAKRAIWWPFSGQKKQMAIANSSKWRPPIRQSGFGYLISIRLLKWLPKRHQKWHPELNMYHVRKYHILWKINKSCKKITYPVRT